MNVTTNKFGEHTKVILKEMCNRVNTDYDKIDFKSNNWYLDYEWTEQEAEEYKNWLTDYLFSKKGARLEIMSHPLKKKKYCENAAHWFVTFYGWKTKK